MPNTIAQNLTRLVNTKTAIANAIVAKGGIISENDGLENFSNLILDLPTSDIKIEEAVENGYLPDYRTITTPVKFDGTNLTSYEFCICFKMTHACTRANVFFGAKNSFYAAPSCEINADGIWQGFAYNGQSPWGYETLVSYEDMPITIDTTGRMQWIKLVWDSASHTQTVLHSFDGVNYTQISTIDTPVTAYSPGIDNASVITLGGINDSYYHFFEGGNDINLYNSYIKMNGKIVFGREVASIYSNDN